MSRRQPLTVALVLQTALDVGILWASRWLRQILFWLGFGAAVGGLTTWWIAHRLTP